MNGAIQAVNYNHELRPETCSFEIDSVDYQTEEAKEVKGHLIDSISFNSEDALSDKSANIIQYVTFQCEEAECNNTLFFYL